MQNERDARKQQEAREKWDVPELADFEVGDVEVLSDIEKIERVGELPGGDVPRDDQGQPMVTPVDPVMPDDAVVLPLTQSQFEASLESQMNSSGKWLAEWCLFMIKKYGRRVFFRGG